MEYLHGFTAEYVIGGQALPVGADFGRPLAFNAGDFQRLDVQFLTPRACEEITILATLEVLYLDSMGQPVPFYLSGSSDGLFPIKPPVLIPQEGSSVLAGYWGTPGVASCIINGYSPVETATWGTVRALYR